MDNTHGTTNCPFTAALAENAPQWAHENTSARAEAALNRNRSELTLAALCLCNPDDDVRHHTTCLTADLGQSTTAACDYRKIGLLLHRMPKLATVLTTRGFAPLHLLKKLATATFPIDQAHHESLEPLLLAALTPRVDKLALPPWRELFGAIQRAIDTVEHPARPTDLAGAPIPEDIHESYRHRPAEDRHSPDRITVTLSRAHAEEAHRVISTIAATDNCDNTTAFMHLIRGTSTASINLHLYRSVDGGPVWMPGVGVLSEALTQEYLSMVTSVDVLHPSTSGGYAATESQRALIIGRDGTCRFPGCTRSAAAADMDHITNHAEGGPTSTDNLHSLCRRHHNEKTKGLWDVTRSLEGTEYWTSIGGAQVATEPAGPLSHPGAVPFAASIRAAAKLRAEHNEYRDAARAQWRNLVARARRAQPIVRMLQSLRIMAPDEGPEQIISAISEHEASKAVAAAARRAEARDAHQKFKARRYQGQVRSLEPVKDPDPPSIAPPDPVVEMMQVYLCERDPMGALAAVGPLLKRVELDQFDVWQRGFADAASLREKVARWRTRRFRHVTRLRS